MNEKSTYIWMDDNLAITCTNCSMRFTLYYRKHHCRICGRIFCYNCCSNFMDIPDSMQITPNIVIPSTPQNAFGFGTSPPKEYIVPNILVREKDKSTNVRVCDRCKKKFNDMKEIKYLITIFNLIGLSLKDYYIMLKVNKTWYQIATYYINKLINIQHKLPDDPLSEIEKKLLVNNAQYIYRHHRLAIPLLPLLDRPKYEVKIPCHILKCRSECRHAFNSDDYIEILYRIRYSPNIESIKKHVVEKLMNDVYLPTLITLMKGDITDQIILYNAVVKSHSHQFLNDYFWENIICGSKLTYEKLLRDCDIRIIMKSYKYIQVIKNIDIHYDTYAIRLLLKDIHGYFPIPTKIDATNMSIDVDNIIRKQSASQPIVFELKNADGSERYRLLYKMEDIRKDYIIMNMIKIIERILRYELGINPYIVSYNIRPISEKAGFIEIIPDCETIYHIKERLNFSILNYIIENNKHESINTIRQRFIYSCASYCVITYLLGIGDRHLENIMITKDGRLFHIDYSYIMGNDAKPLTTPYMRITTDMVDALGGVNSTYYREFKELCNRIFKCLREHLNLFIVILTTISDATPAIDGGIHTREKIIGELVRRFMIGQDKEAELHLYNTIDNCSKDYNSMIYDFFHYQNKEGVVNSARNILSRFF